LTNDEETERSGHQLPSQDRHKNGRHGFRWVSFVEQTNLRNGNS